MLIECARENHNLGPWAKWVVDDAGPVARETREFLETCFANISNNKKGAACREARSDIAENVDALFYELLCHELLRRLGLSPEFKPKLSGGLTPDMLAKVAGQDFIVEVFVTNNPIRTIIQGQGLMSKQGTSCMRQFTKDQEDRAKKIREEVKKKHNQYANTGKPILIAVFLKDSWMQVGEVESALYGACRGDEHLVDCFPDGIAKFKAQAIKDNFAGPLPDGAMIPDDCGKPGCPKLSAVLACDWFDSSDHDCPGRRLHCMVLHHWKPDVSLPTGMFADFPEIAWRRDKSGCSTCELKGSERVAARFSGPDGLEFRDYDPASPW